jgi:hypothetical protein
MIGSEKLAEIATRRDMLDKPFFIFGSMLNAMDLTPYTPKAFAGLDKSSDMYSNVGVVDTDMAYMLEMSRRPDTITMEEILPSELCQQQIDESDHYGQSQSLFDTLDVMSDSEETSVTNPSLP